MDGNGDVTDRLSCLGGISARVMFGGYDHYWRDTIFAIAYGTVSSSRWTTVPNPPSRPVV